MMRSITLALFVVAASASAQDLSTYNKALSAYNGANYEEAAKLFFELNSTSTDNDLRAKAEYYLASSFQRQNLPFAASIYFSTMVRAGPTHPFHLKAVEGLVSVQEQLEDNRLIPKLLNDNFNKFADSWGTLPLEVLARVNYLIGRFSHGRAQMDEAKSFFEAVPSESSIYHKAQYMLGLTLADPRLVAASDEERRKNSEKAIEVFEALLKYRPPNRKDLDETHELSVMALGRVNYNIGEYAKATQWYESVPRFSKFWDQALFENGYARFQNDDLGGGLGSLQALQAPQFAGAFQPDSWVFKSTIYYFSCLYEEGRTALKEFDAIYLPMSERLKPLADKIKSEKSGGSAADPSYYFKLVDATDSEVLPKPVLNAVRADDSMISFLAILKEIEREKQVLADNQTWRAVKLSQEVTTYLDQNRGVIEKLAGQKAKSAIVAAYDTIKVVTDNSEIIRFEISLREKELAERGVDQAKMLGQQTLYRPAMPAENWNYWKFQGEFWRDEIGYYQYTLKRGCPAN